jgi:4-amino-4-deoxychorismate lyase
MAPTFQLFTSLRYDPLLTTLSINTSHWDDDLKNGSPSPFYMLPHHRDRILQAALHFGWTEAAAKISGHEGFTNLLNSLTTAIDTTSPHPLRVRVLLSYDGSIKIETSPTPTVTQWNLYPSRIPPSKDVPKMKVSPLTGGALEVGADDSVHGDPTEGVPWDIIADKVRTTPSPYTAYKTTSRDMYVSARERAGIKDMAEKREVLIISEKDGEIMEGSLTSPFFWREGRWITPPLESGGQAGTTRRWALERGICVERVVKVDELVDGELCWISNGVRGFQLGRLKLS